LKSQSSPNTFQTNPTIASGDFKVSIDGEALNNLATLPTVTPAGGKMVKISLSADEMNGDNIMVVGSDAAGAEWCDVTVEIQTSIRQIDDLSILTAADVWANGSRTLSSFGSLVSDIWASIVDSSGVTTLLARLTSTRAGYLDNLDAAVTTRLASVLYTAPDNTSIAAIKTKTDNLPLSPASTSDIPTSSQNADAVWDEALSGHLTSGTTGSALNGASSAGDPWNTALPGAYGAGTAGKIVGDNLDAKVSTRSSHSAADIWAVGTRTLTSFGTLVADIWANTVRTITGGTITTNSDKVNYSLVANYNPAKTAAQASDIPTAAQNADAVWDEAISGHLTGGTTGASLNASGSAGDPWTTPLPGAYADGTAGKILATRSSLDGTGVQSAMTSQGYTSARAGYLDVLNGILAAIWGYATRTLSAFGFTVTTNQVLGADSKALLSSDAHTGAVIPRVTLVDTTTDLTNAGTVEISPEQLVDLGRAVWTGGSRTLTQGAASVISAVTGNDITVYSATDINFELTGLPNLTDWERVWFTVKRSKSNTDAESILQLLKSNPGDDTKDGLLYVNRVKQSNTNRTRGYISVLSNTSIRVHIHASASSELQKDESIYYDIKAEVAGEIIPISEGGKFNIEMVITRAI
jgi:hypothetical protein